MSVQSKTAPSRLCQLCGKREAASKEHLPGQSAGNKGRVTIDFLDAASRSNTMQSHTIVSNEGFWLPVLCEECNRRTGSRYGTSYFEFISQISEARLLYARSDRTFFVVRRTYPLRVLKQMFSMFLCANPYPPTEQWKALQEFVLHRDSRLGSNAPSVYLYMNTSRKGRIVPFCGITDLISHEKFAISEISWPPLGIVFSFLPTRLFDEMQNITDWASFRFDQQTDVRLNLPMHRVNTHYPLGFGSTKRIEQKAWVFLYHVPKDSKSPTNYSAVIERR